MANRKRQQNKKDAKLRMIDTVLVVAMLLACLVSLPLAIVTLVHGASKLVMGISIAVISFVAVAVISAIADVILGGKPAESIGRILEEPETVDDMTGIQFENYVAERLIAAGWSDVELTPASGDHGVDVLGTWDGVRYAIQCKRYRSSVDTKAIQEVYTGRGVYGTDRAVVITNSTFTRQAKEMADKLDVELWHVDKLEEFMENAE